VVRNAIKVIFVNEVEAEQASRPKGRVRILPIPLVVRARS
jgi:hypothetical protein